MPRSNPIVMSLIAALSLGLSCQAQAEIFFNANLTGAQETTPGSTTASGTATFVLNDAQTALRFNATIFGLDFTGSQSVDALDNLTAAHIHAPGAPGVNAPVVWGFLGAPFNDNAPNDIVVTPFASGIGGSISGKWDSPEGNNTTLTAQLPNILAGNAYINFHTAQFPGGAIRGQIIAAAVPEPATLSLLAAGLLAGFGGLKRAKQLS